MSFKLTTGNIAYPSASASISSNGDTSATIKVAAGCYLGDGWVQSTGVVAKIYINGSLVSTQTILGNGTAYSASTYKEVSASSSVSKGTSSKSVSWSVGFHQYTDGTDQGCKQTLSGSTTISAKTSYTVSYNANGGSGAPSSQTKWYGTTLTLSTTKPTRTGYSFKNWNTNSGGTGTSYAAGASYTANSAATLYAQWTANTYTVKYDANGGSGAPSSQTKTYGVNLTLSSTKPTRTNYNFLGWGTSASATTVAYAAGATYSANSAITLYAIWELAYWKPKITNLSAARCASDGTADEYGTYALVKFDWELCQLLGTNNISSITIDCNSVTTTVSASGISGSVSQVVGADALSTDGTFDITITVADSMDGSTSSTKTIATSAFTIDFLAGGKGVAFGKAAENEGFDCNMAAYFEKGLTEDIPINVSGNCNSLTTTGKYYIGSSGTNRPVALNGWLESKKYSTDYCHQVYTTYQGHTYTRLMAADTWGSWNYIYGVDGSKSTNKVLWSGAYHMNASQTVTLSEAVSNQNHGIVLVWSRYQDSEAQNYNFTSFVVLKQMVASHGGNGHYFSSCERGRPFAKYVYISDTKITGYSYNTTDDTVNGLTMYNSYCVLRYILGF